MKSQRPLLTLVFARKDSDGDLSGFQEPVGHSIEAHLQNPFHVLRLDDLTCSFQLVERIQGGLFAEPLVSCKQKLPHCRHAEHGVINLQCQLTITFSYLFTVSDGQVLAESTEKLLSSELLASLGFCLASPLNELVHTLNLKGPCVPDLLIKNDIWVKVSNPCP